MKTNIAVAFAISAGLFALVLQASATEKAAKGGHAVVIPAADIKWKDVPNAPGAKMAVVEGDATKGPHHAFHKLPAGFSSPLHHHSADLYVTVISGTLVSTVDGKEQKLPAGSYFSYIGKKKHETKCDAGSECVLFIDARGKWDLVEETKPES